MSHTPAMKKDIWWEIGGISTEFQDIRFLKFHCTPKNIRDLYFMMVLDTVCSEKFM